MGDIRVNEVKTDIIKNTSGTNYNFIKQVLQGTSTTESAEINGSSVDAVTQAITPSSTSSSEK